MSRWRGQYAWPEGYTGWNWGPEVWADTKEEALEKAIRTFHGLVNKHKHDHTFFLFFKLGKEIEFDPAKVSVKSIGSGLIQQTNVEIKAMPMPDFSALYAANYDIEKKP